jgi:hypothetical protein
MPKIYTTYHTNLKLCYSLGIENQIFPEEFLEQIPKTTSQYWKKRRALTDSLNRNAPCFIERQINNN